MEEEVPFEIAKEVIEKAVSAMIYTGISTHTSPNDLGAMVHVLGMVLKERYRGTFNEAILEINKKTYEHLGWQERN